MKWGGEKEVEKEKKKKKTLPPTLFQCTSLLLHDLLLPKKKNGKNKTWNVENSEIENT